MEEAPENSKESSYSAHANGMNEWVNGVPLQKTWIFGIISVIPLNLARWKFLSQSRN